MTDVVAMFWYIVAGVFGSMCVYIYRTLSTSSGSQFEDNSIDAFIIPDDGLGSSTPAKMVSDKYKREYTTEGCQVLILYGTEYGFSEEIAKLLYDRIAGITPSPDGTALQPRLVNVRDHHIVDFTQEQVCFLVISTSGDGVPPSDARPFYYFMHETNLHIPSLRYSVLALGDSNYPQYCQTGRQLEKRFVELGCRSMIQRHDVDMEDWNVINRWFDSILCYLATARLEPRLDYLDYSAINEEKYSRHSPFMATLKVKRLLTKCETSDDKETIHCEFDLSESDLEWRSGDALGIYPHNNPPEVTRLLKVMNCTGREQVDKPSWNYREDKDKTSPDLREALTKYYDLKVVKPELISLLRQNQKMGTNGVVMAGSLKDMSDAELQGYLHDRELADVLEDCSPHTLSWQQLLGCMKPLQPRYYSISSSPVVDSTTATVTAAVLRYTTHGWPRTGVTTTYLHDRLHVGDTCPVFMSRNPDFRLPSNPSCPVICIGPGTGIAPFRAFIQERERQPGSGAVQLYFGCRHKNKDFLYRSELEHWDKCGVVTLRAAFSRDQERKIYIQDLIYEDKSTTWDLIHKQQACVYVCGDARHMAHDVHDALLNIAQGEGRMTGNEAAMYLKHLEEEKRYQKDVWIV